MELLLGVVITTQFFGSVIAAYVLWKYVYHPWKIIRADQLAIRKEFEVIRNDIGLRRVMAQRDMDSARIESRAEIRRLVRETPEV